MDKVNTYAKVVLELGLLFLELEDISREGDGKRNNVVWKVLLYYFRATGHHKYALQALYRVMQIEALLSPRMSAQLTWSQFCSASTGGNKPNDLAVEHNNGDLKSSLRAMGPNKTLPAVQRYAAASVPLSTIESAFDSIASVPPSSGRHTARSNDGDVQKMVKSLHTACVFSNVPSRHHERFQHVTSPLQSLITQPANRFAEWYSSHQKKMSRKKVYKSVFN